MNKFNTLAKTILKEADESFPQSKLQRFELIDEQGFEDPEVIEASSYQEALEKALELLGKVVQPYSKNKGL